MVKLKAGEDIEHVLVTNTEVSLCRNLAKHPNYIVCVWGRGDGQNHCYSTSLISFDAKKERKPNKI